MGKIGYGFYLFWLGSGNVVQLHAHSIKLISSTCSRTNSLGNTFCGGKILCGKTHGKDYWSVKVLDCRIGLSICSTAGKEI